MYYVPVMLYIFSVKVMVYHFFALESAITCNCDYMELYGAPT